MRKVLRIDLVGLSVHTMSATGPAGVVPMAVPPKKCWLLSAAENFQVMWVCFFPILASYAANALSL
jgi:hypothetical protein